MIKDQRKENAHAHASVTNPDSPKKNRFYALQSQVYKERSPNVVTHSKYFPLMFIQYWITMAFFHL